MNAAVKTEATPTKLAGGVTVTRNAPDAVGLGCPAAEADPAGASMPQVKAEPPQGPASAPALLTCSVKEERDAALEEPLAEALLQGLSTSPVPPVHVFTWAVSFKNNTFCNQQDKYSMTFVCLTIHASFGCGHSSILPRKETSLMIAELRQPHLVFASLH